jgi:hypothetical protein
MDEPERSKAVTVGYHLSGALLIEQANATKTTALADMPAFKAEGMLGDEDITQLDALVEEVHQGLADRTVASVETRAQTTGQATAMHDLKVDRRRLDHSVDRAFRNKPEHAQYQQYKYQGSGVAATCNEMNVKLAFAKEHQAPLSRVGITQVFLAKVEAEVRALEQKSGAQDAAVAQLPASTRAYCEAKGRLYLALKDINSAGHALHCGDLQKSANYNLKVLYGRKLKAKAESPAPSPAPAATPK